MIKNIVFDMGNVLIRFKPELFMTRLGIEGDDRQLILRTVFQSIEWAALDHGTMNDEQAVQSICRRLPERLHETAKQLVEEWDEPLIEIEEMYDLAKALKDNGYRLFLLTNASTRQRSYWARAKAAPLMDGVLVSAEEKLIKPQPEIFNLLCQRFGLDVGECFFIDDNLANAEAAIFCGMKSAVFHDDLDELKTELRAEGVNI